MVQSRGLVLFLLCLPGGARRSMRVDDSFRDAEQQSHTLASGLGVSADAREALVPGSMRQRLTHRPPVAMSEGKGFGGGEATRDPEPTVYDPNDPKGKQQAIHKAESFADYLARRKAEEAKAGDPSMRSGQPVMSVGQGFEATMLCLAVVSVGFSSMLAPLPHQPVGRVRLPSMGLVDDVPVFGAYTASATDLLSGILAKTPLSELASSPLYQPVASVLALIFPAWVVAQAAKAVAERLLVPVLRESALKDSLPPEQYELGKRIGKGSFGAVYEGFQKGESEPSKVIKQITDRRFGFSELFVIRKLTACGQTNCMARFQGHYYDNRNLHLVFERQGELTLFQAMGARDFPANVAESITGSASADMSLEAQAKVIRKISRQIFSNLAGLHKWNVVHRDIKGSNLILAERERAFKLIDFGAAIDLVSLTNYDPNLQVFDPSYGPPEATPGEGGIVLSEGGKFDVFSAGLLVVQMCFPPFRSDNGIKRFKKMLEACDWDLREWRTTVEDVAGYQDGFEILDKYGGFGLLTGCLKQEPSKRISAAGAAGSGFCRV